MADWICPNCDRRIHALDGSISSNGGPFRHVDCDAAAEIDYAAAFDRLHGAMCDIGYLSHELMEESVGGWEDRDPNIERLIGALWVKPGEALDYHWLRTGERPQVPASPASREEEQNG